MISVLLVEDNPLHAKLLNAYLTDQSDGYDFVLRTTLSDALSFLRESNIDVLLLDLLLPDSHGIETLERAHQEFPDLPIVVLTSHDTEELSRVAIQKGAQDYLVKGTFQAPLLDRAIRYALERHTLNQQIQQSTQVLMARETLLSHLARHSSDIISIIDEAGKRYYISPSVERILGYPPEQLDGSNIFDEIHPEDREGVRTLFSENIRRRVSELVEFRVRHSDGSWLWFETIGNYYPSENGVKRFVINSRDITQRRLSEEAQRRAEEQYRTIVESVHAIVWRGDADTLQFTFVSREAESLLGYSVNQWTEESDFWVSHIHPDDRERAVSFCRKAARERRSHDFEYRMIASDGRVVWLRDQVRVLVSGDRAELVGVMIDITQAKSAEGRQNAQLAVTRLFSEAKSFESAITGFLEAIVSSGQWAAGELWMVDEASAELVWRGGYRDDPEKPNPFFQASRLISFPVGEGIPGTVLAEGKPVWVSDVSESVENLRPHLAARCAIGFPIQSETEIMGAVLLYADQIVAHDEQIESFLVDLGYRIGQFVEARRVQEKVFRRDKQLSAAQQIAHVGSFEWDVRSQIITWSDELYRIFGLESQEYDGTLESFLAKVYPADRAHVEDLINRSFTEVEQEPMQYRIVQPDGSIRTVESRRELVYDSDGQLLRLVGTIQDTTDQRMLENQLEQANRLSSLGRLAATVAHEFNNVLMGIQPSAELIKRRGALNDEAGLALDRILHSIQRGKRITQEILRFTQPSEPVVQTVDVNQWFDVIRPEWAAVAGKEVDLKIELPDERLFVKADPVQLNQIFTNLIVNARDAMPNGGTLTVNAEPCRSGCTFAFGIVPSIDRFIHFTVADTGTGIEPDVLRHIFEPLFTTKKSGGTGLGLAVTHQVIRHHGGHVFVDSRPGRGTAFHIFLLAAEPSFSATAIPAERRSMAGLRLLLVEDEIAVASGIAAVLELEDLTVNMVHRGEDAVPAIEKDRPHAVILDVGLPDMDGVAVYELIALKWPDLPVIFSTGHGDESKLAEYLARPNVRFLMKPYDLDTLLGVLGTLGI